MNSTILHKCAVISEGSWYAMHQILPRFDAFSPRYRRLRVCRVVARDRRDFVVFFVAFLVVVLLFTVAFFAGAA